MDDMAAVALSITPELARKFASDPTGEAASAAIGILRAVVGSSEPAVVAAILQRDPALATQLHLELTALANSRQNTMPTTPAASAPELSLSDGGTLFTWAAPVISGVVVISFGVVVVVVLTSGVTAGNETAANMLLGTLAAMATSVVSYWVGSSAGSARKDERLSQIAR